MIGAQNAGKSTLINAIAKKQGVKITRLTEAAVPGTTLGILRVTGVLPAKAKMYDTPGLLHPYVMAMRLNNEERKMVEIRKELRPRSFRVKVSDFYTSSIILKMDFISIQGPITVHNWKGLFCAICYVDVIIIFEISHMLLFLY